MRKIIILAALTISAGLSAQINWYGTVENNAGGLGTSNVESIETYTDGSVLFAGKFSTASLTPSNATFLNAAFMGAPFTPDQSKTNYNAYFIKVQKNGNPIWALSTNRGSVKAEFAVPTSDGGALLAFYGTYSDKNKQGDNKVMQLMNGNTHLASDIQEYKTYFPSPTSKEPKPQNYGYIIKVSPDGQSASIVTRIRQTDTIVDGFAMLDLVKTNGTYLLSLLVTNTIMIDNETISPVSGGEPFVLVLNESGQVTKTLSTQHEGYTSTLLEATADATNIYTATTAAVDGQQSILITTFDRSTGEVVATDSVLGVTEGGINRIQVKALTIDGTYMYIAGGVNGGLKLENDTLHNANKKFHAFVLKYDLLAHKAVEGYIRTSTGIGAATNLLVVNDTLYAYLYDWGSAKDEPRILLQGLDKKLQPTREIGLIKSTGMPTCTDAAFNGEDVIFSLNAAKDAAMTFIADESITLKETSINGVVASIKIAEKSNPTSLNEIPTIGDTTHKIVRNGQVVIIKNGVCYNLLGQIIDKQL